MAYLIRKVKPSILYSPSIIYTIDGKVVNNLRSPHFVIKNKDRVGIHIFDNDISNFIKLEISLINLVLAEALKTDKIEFDLTKNELYISAFGVEFILSDKEVKVISINKNGKRYTKGSLGSGDWDSRNTKMPYSNNRISLSRLWCLGKAICLGTLKLKDVDKFVHNHKKNNGRVEGAIAGQSGLDVSNYELIPRKEDLCMKYKCMSNNEHEKKWKKAKNMGVELHLSCYDLEAKTIIENSSNKITLINGLNELKKQRKKRGKPERVFYTIEDQEVWI